MIKETIKAHNNFNPEPLTFKNKGGKSKRQIATDFIAMDTETSHNHDRDNAIGWIYQWCFKYNNELIYGRKPSQLAQCLKKIKEVNNLSDNRNIVIYIHNMSYDYTYIKDWIQEIFKDYGDLLAVRSHKLISFEIAGFIFKCSYFLSQKSLAGWAKDLGVKHRKLVGAVDYDIIRYQDTPLYKNDWKYMFYDVITLDECIRKQLEIHHDTLLTVPLTNTGYVRRDCRNRFIENQEENKAWLLSTQLSYETYTMCRREFAGALTHGNRTLISKKINGIIRHRDFASHYPSQQVCYGFPTTKFTCYYRYNDSDIMTLDEVLELTKKYCLLMDVQISNLKLKDGITLPYAQAYKFYEGRVGKYDAVEDNGRIIDMPTTSMVTLTEIDLKWLVKQYDFTISFIRIFKSKRGHAPQYLIDTVKQYFYDKTFFKNEEKRLEKEGYGEDTVEWQENHIKLMIAKGMLNGIYGMSAQDPVRDEYDEDKDGEWHKYTTKGLKIMYELEKYYKSYNSFMAYQIGVWTTANARNELLEFVELIGYENFIYADTDSIFYISTSEIEEKIEAQNKLFRDIDDEKGYYIEIEGKRTYFNQFDLEKEDIVEFKFLHSKCYAYKLSNGEMKVTIAGVAKHGRNGKSRVKELGSLDNLKHGKTFIDCGGTITKYMNKKPCVLDLDGHYTEVASSAIIYNGEKTLSCEVVRDETSIEWQCA